MKTVFIALAIASLANPAITAAEQRSLSVKTGDLNLATAKGQKALALRIHRAASELCKSEALEQLPAMQRAERRCIEGTKASAIAAAGRKTGERAGAATVSV
jgi:UrcA family protein